MSARPQLWRAGIGAVLMLALALLSWVIFRGYLTPEMMVYFLTFQWCF